MQTVKFKKDFIMNGLNYYKDSVYEVTIKECNYLISEDAAFPVLILKS